MGFLLIGLGGYLIYREIKTVRVAVWVKLPSQLDFLARAVQTPTQSLVELNRELALTGGRGWEWSAQE